MSRALFAERGRPADAADLVRLASECFAQPWTKRQYEEELALSPPSGVLLLRERRAGRPPTRIVALCAIRAVADELQVLDLAVLPERRRLGLARFLLALALRTGARNGARLALLEVREGNTAALALYAAFGFRRAGRRRDYYREPVEDALLLERGSLDELC